MGLSLVCELFRVFARCKPSNAPGNDPKKDLYGVSVSGSRVCELSLGGFADFFCSLSGVNPSIVPGNDRIKDLFVCPVCTAFVECLSGLLKTNCAPRVDPCCEMVPTKTTCPTRPEKP